MDVNFIKMHNPTNAAPEFRGKSHLGDYSDSLMELDADIGRIMDAIRAEAPNTIVIVTADNGAWLDAYPDAGTTPFRGEKGSPFEGGWRVPGHHVVAGSHSGWRAVRRDDVAHRLLGDARGDGRPDAAAARLGRQRRQADLFRQHRQQRLHPRQGAALGAQVVGLYRRRESSRARAPTSAAIPRSPGSTSPGSTSIRPRIPGSARRRISASIGALYNLTMDPYEKYDMIFNGAAPARTLTSSPGNIRARTMAGRCRCSSRSSSTSTNRS